MKKVKMMRVGLLAILAAVLVFASSVSATNTSPTASRVIYFSIQNNLTCSDGSFNGNNYMSGFSLNLNNLGKYPAEATVYLYKKDGTEMVLSGFTTNGVATDITPGEPVIIAPYATVQYFQEYGFSSITAGSCSERPLYGKIVVDSDSGLLLASGEVFGRRIEIPSYDVTTYFNTTVNINNGQPF